MSQIPTPYQPFHRHPGATLSAPELADEVRHQVACRQPEDPDAPEGEWHCENDRCAVHEVAVHCKLLDGQPMPEVMKCPACRKPMKFLHWLGERTLVPQAAQS